MESTDQGVEEPAWSHWVLVSFATTILKKHYQKKTQKTLFKKNTKIKTKLNKKRRKNRKNEKHKKNEKNTK